MYGKKCGGNSAIKMYGKKMRWKSSDICVRVMVTAIYAVRVRDIRDICEGVRVMASRALLSRLKG
jgi:hypothetical protein